MINEDFAWASTSIKGSFEERFILPLRNKNRELFAAMDHNWSLSKRQEFRLQNYAKRSDVNDFCVALHIARYAPTKHSKMEQSWEKIENFMDEVYNNERFEGDVGYFREEISKFLKFNKEACTRFNNFCDAWETVPAQMEEAFKDDPGIDEPF